MIPTVKTWIVTTEDGTKHEVLAPTKFLARLNFRHEIGWAFSHPIKSIGLTRKNTKG